MLEKLSTITLGRYRPSLLIWLLVLIIGSFTYVSLLDREGFPPVEVPFAVTTGTYFIDDAGAVDESVISPITDELDELDEVVSVQSTARPDSFSIVSEFTANTTSETGAKLIRDALKNAELNLPESSTYTVESVSATKFNNQFDLLVSVFYPQSDEASLTELEDRAENLAQRIGQDPSVQRAEVDSLFTQSSGPEPGDTQTRQTAFSRYGETVDGDFRVYQSVVVGVVAAEGTDEIQLDENVNGIISSWSTPEASARISAGFADSIRTQIASLQENVLTGLVAVLLVVGLLISWRAAVVIALFIPTVLAATLMGIFISGNTLNTIVLFALVLVLGLIVDNAIVVTEAIEAQNKVKKRMQKQKLIRSSISRVGLAVAAGTLTTVLVFAPILFVSGILGDFIRILPATVIIALTLSLVVAIVYIPFFAGPLLLRRQGTSSRRHFVFHQIERFCLYVPRKLSRTANRLRRAILSLSMVLISLVLIGFGVVLLRQLPFNIFPAADDADSLLVNISFDSSVDIATAQTMTDEANKILYSTIGDDIRRVSYPQASAQGAVAQVELVPFTERSTTSRTYVDRLDSSFAESIDADISVRQIDAGPPPESFPFALQIYGEDVQNNLSFAGEVASFLEDEAITRPDGTTVPIEEVRVTDDLSVIRRDQGRRYLEVTARYDADDTSGLLDSTRSAVEQKYDDSALASFRLTNEDIRFDFGQESENEASFASAQFAFLVAVGLMYILLVLQFNSFSQPLLILLAVPFGLLGVGVGLNLYNHALSFFVLIGLIGLIGIVVNNAILLVDFANQQRRDNATALEAITSSLQQRLRPIITTTLTTIAALSPLALSDPFWEPLAITIIFGLISSTVLVVFCFPYYYLAIEAIRDRKNRRWPALK